MITARPAFSTTRTRHQVGPLRVLWLAALLFAFLYTHAAGADSATAHSTAGAITVPHLAPADTGDFPHAAEQPDHRDDSDGGHPHPAEACASGHPQQGYDLPGPLAAVAVRTPAFNALTPQQWTQILSCDLPPSPSSLGSVVQQV